jgi:hypothetical protein
MTRTSVSATACVYLFAIAIVLCPSLLMMFLTGIPSSASWSLPLLDTVAHGERANMLNNSTASTALSKCCNPRQRTWVPGMPSLFRPKCPPSCPTIRTASAMVGGLSGGRGFLVTRQHSRFPFNVSKE